MSCSIYIYFFKFVYRNVVLNIKTNQFNIIVCDLLQGSAGESTVISGGSLYMHALLSAMLSFCMTALCCFVVTQDPAWPISNCFPARAASVNFWFFIAVSFDGECWYKAKCKMLLCKIDGEKNVQNCGISAKWRRWRHAPRPTATAVFTDSHHHFSTI